MLKKNLLLCLLLLLLQSGNAQSDPVRMFIFGHSLLDHRPPLIPTPSDETTVPHWLHLLAQDAGESYAATGQYGFLPQHANLPPFAQWGYDIVPPVWDSDLEPFADADFNKILITAGNFMQWQGPGEPYPGQGTMSPISATETIVDWLVTQESGLGIYLYENWPDMAPYLGNNFPPTESEFDDYNAYTNGAFHDWWIEYQDSLLLSRPDINVRMIPVGPILADLYGGTLLSGIPITDLYEDDAPHGRATTYFLASLITYMAVNHQKASSSYAVPAIVHPLVAANYLQIVDYIWAELNAFNTASGESRVFDLGGGLPVSWNGFIGKKVADGIALEWTTIGEVNNGRFEVEYSSDGRQFQQIGMVAGKGTIAQPQHYAFMHRKFQVGANYYRLKQIDFDGDFSYSEVISIRVEKGLHRFTISPNPASVQNISLQLNTASNEAVNIRIYSLTGRLLNSKVETPMVGENQFLVDWETATKGMFVIKVQQGDAVFSELLVID